MDRGNEICRDSALTRRIPGDLSRLRLRGSGFEKGQA